jgi:hypothetical protein
VCGLDNREARLAVNKACWKVNRPWVDGATEGLQGVARVFVPPDGVCYECTLGEQDQRIMAFRDSCGFFGREAYRQGHTPTTPTTSAVIAGVQVQEAIKLLHAPGLVGAKDWEHKPVALEQGSSSQSFAPTVTPAASLVGKGFFFDGDSYDCFTIDYTRREDCLSHETFENVIETDLASDTATLADVMQESGGKQIPRDARNDFDGAHLRVRARAGNPVPPAVPAEGIVSQIAGPQPHLQRADLVRIDIGGAPRQGPNPGTGRARHGQVRGLLRLPQKRDQRKNVGLLEVRAAAAGQLVAEALYSIAATKSR